MAGRASAKGRKRRRGWAEGLAAQCGALRPAVKAALGGERASVGAQLLVMAALGRWLEARVAGGVSATLAERLGDAGPLGAALREALEAGALDAAVAGLDAAMAALDPDELLAEAGAEASDADPLGALLEPFLQACDPEARSRGGAYFTPDEVARWLVEAVDTLLARELGLIDGLAHGGATPGLQVLDPAAGAGVFLRATWARLHRRLGAALAERARGGALPVMTGVELMALSHAVCGMQLRTWWRGLGRPLEMFEALELRHGDALADPGGDDGSGPATGGCGPLGPDPQVAVVLGNPPWRGHSDNRGAWILGLLRDYRKGCPELERPGQAKWLSDDYVKFMRLAQHRVQRAGRGVLAFVTNHAWLDNPTFRGMRASLLSTFDRVWILDLHGNAKRKERTADGGRDESVFGISQGAALCVLVRTGASPDQPQSAALARVWRADLRGSRADKLACLRAHAFDAFSWRALRPQAPGWLLSPEDPAKRASYGRGVSLRDLFAPLGAPAPGIVTTHDSFAISHTPQEAIAKVEALLGTRDETEARSLFSLCRQSQWRYDEATAALADGAWRTQLAPVLYRPFDVRHTVWNRHVAVHRRERLSRHLRLPGARAICVARAVEIDRPWQHVWATTLPLSHHAVSTKEVNYAFPMLLQTEDDGPLRPGIAPEVLAATAQRLGWDPPDDPAAAMVVNALVFHAVYAILHAPAWRRHFRAELRTDFPRVPLDMEGRRLLRLGELGRRLFDLHAMQTLQPIELRVIGHGDGRVARVRHEGRDQGGRLWFNPSQYVEPVPEAIWAYAVGGARVCERWLRDRRGWALEGALLRRLGEIAGALAATVELGRAIDQAMDGVATTDSGRQRRDPSRASVSAQKRS